MFELLTSFTISELLLSVILYCISTVLLSFFVLGLFLASNHKFVENGKEKGLILVDFKERLDSIFLALDKYRLSIALKNWTALVLPLIMIGIATVKILQTSNWDYAALYFSSVFFVMFKKSFEEIGVMVLGCFRCMSTFWVAFPLMLVGYIMGFSINPIYFWYIPFGIFTTSVVSGMVSFIYMSYDKCKLAVEDFKREREIYRMQLQNEAKASEKN